MFDDDEFVPFRGFSQAKKTEKDYTKPISFKRSSTNDETNGQEEVDENPQDEMEQEEESNEEIEYIIEEEDLALKHSKKQNLSNTDFRSMFSKKPDPKVEEPEEEKESNFTVIQPKKKEESERKKRKLEENKEAQPTQQVKRDKGFAGFLDNKVGKNVLNMMLNMGYNADKGLGKDESGRVNPIQMVATDKGRGEIISEESELEKEKIKMEQKKLELPSREDNWKKNKKKPKIKFITADELVEKTVLQPIVTEIIDMTGPNTRILTSSKEISFNQQNSTLSKILPELQYNINQLVILSENSIRDTDKNMGLTREKLIFLNSEKTKLANRIEKQRKDKKELTKILEIVNEYYVRMKQQDDDLDLTELKENFEFLQMNFPDTYKKFKISKCLLSIIQPNLKKEYENWSPFDEVKRVEKIKFLKSLFTQQEDYEILLNEIILPNLRKTLFESNLKQDTKKILKFFKTWKNILTENLTNSLVDKILLPKIKLTIEEWNPKKELIHDLILDWIPMLGVQFELFGLYELIKNKIIKFLNEQEWNAGSDLSIFKYLKIWKDIFPSHEDHFTKIINLSIIPKLIQFLSNDFKINPANQVIEPFMNILKWNELIPTSLFVSIFEQEFFSKWIQILYQWLKNQPNFNEILNWYNGWKQIFPDNFLENERVQSLFNKGLDMINQALSNQEIILEEKKEKYEKKFEHLKPKAQNFSFRELLEQFASEENILFEPKGNQKYLGKQLYVFGGVSLYIDNEIIYAKNNETYSPVSLNELLDLIKK